MRSSESIHNKFFQLSVSTGSRFRSGYERVYETEIDYSILLKTASFHWHSGHGASWVSSPNSTQPTSSAAEHTGN